MFHPDEDQFEIRHKATLLHCERMKAPGLPVFKVVFSSSRPPLIVARAKQEAGVYFWTSIPEGRQKEAEGVGQLIENYFQLKTKD